MKKILSMVMVAVASIFAPATANAQWFEDEPDNIFDLVDVVTSSEGL